MAADDREAYLGAGLVPALAALPRLWPWQIGGLPLADEADGGGPTGSDAAVEDLDASPLKSWAVSMAEDDGEADLGAGLVPELAAPPRL